MRPALLASAIVVAFLLRIVDLATPELWLDEVISWTVTKTSAMPGALALHMPPLYHLMLSGWCAVFGESEIALRSLSAVLGTLSVGVTALTARRIFGDRVALWSAVFAVLAPLHVYYSREARPYALLLLGVGLAQATLWRALERNDLRSWVVFYAAAAAALASHLFAAFALAALAAWPMLWPERGRVRPFAVGVVAGGALAAVAFGGAVLRHLELGPLIDSVSWIDGIWRDTPPALAILRTLEVFALGGHEGLLPLAMKQFDVPAPAALRAFGIVIAGALAVVVAMRRGDDDLGVPWIGRRKAMVAIALFAPLLALWLLSWIRPIYVAARYDLPAFPAFALLAGVAVAKVEAALVPRPALRAAALALLALPLVVKLVLYHGVDDPQASRRVAEALVSDADEGDLLILTELRGKLLRYPLDQLGWRWVKKRCLHRESGRMLWCRVYPLETEATDTFDSEKLASEPDRARDDLESYLRPVDAQARIHLVLGKFATSPAGSIAATAIDAQLIAEIVRAGFRPVAADPDLGILTYRR